MINFLGHIKYFIFISFLYSVNAFNYKNICASLLLASSLNMPKIGNENVYTQPITVKVSDNNIYFYGPITKESCQELDEALIQLDKNSKIFSSNFGIDPLPINLHIQSEGGSLMNTFYVIDLINNLETPVYTYVDGYVASAGSLISVVGKKRFMTKNSFIMIHQLSSSLGQGKFNDFDDNMDNLNKFMSTLRNIYLQKTKIPIDVLNNILEHDLWMDSKESLDYGLVDYII
jgi:ATP-dependent protease ClpP protease subunit